MANVLIIDDDHLFAETVADKLTTLQHSATSAHTLKTGIEQAEKGSYDVLFLDVYLPDGNGLAQIELLRSVPSQPQVIIITGQGDPDGAEMAIQHGAWCYLQKQTFVKEVALALTRALQYRQALQKQRGFLQLVERKELIGESSSFKRCLELLAKVAAAETNVLITGASGTGKEAFARAIHDNSKRSKANFVVVDCAALPEQLVESVLFGHAKGAFTGADKANRGLIRHADNGTLFLDEIGELPLSIQKNFLRVLQERRFCPVGSQEEVHSNFRLISATNRNLPKMVKEGLFREDLFHRLRSNQIELPPLVARGNDIKLLADHFLLMLCQRYKQEKKEFVTEFLEHLMAYPWPGNVRELGHTIESSFAEAVHSPLLFPQHLPIHIRTHFARFNVECATAEPISVCLGRNEPLLPWKEAKGEFEQQYLAVLLQQAEGNIMQAGRLSKLSRTRLYQLINKYNLSVQERS